MRAHCFFTPRTWDILGATALIAWNSAAAAGLLILLARDLPRVAELSVAPQAAARAMAVTWLALQVYFLCVRVSPRMKLEGVMPRLTAFAGAYVAGIIVFLPANNKPFLHVISGLISIAGTAGCIYTLAFLGRAFAIFPQSRKLVTDGPYKIVRHPLYLFEQIVTFGVALLYVQPWALLAAALCFGLQFPRMSLEERVLAKTFPEYRQYMQRTWRLLPGVY